MCLNTEHTHRLINESNITVQPYQRLLSYKTNCHVISLPSCLLCGGHGVVALGDECLAVALGLPAHSEQLESVWARTHVPRDRHHGVRDALLQVNAADRFLETINPLSLGSSGGE